MQRQVRFIAKVIKPSDITIYFNQSKVFEGKVCGTDDLEPICEWTTDTSVTGYIPMKIKINQGEIVWADLYMNYTGSKLAFPGSQSLGHQRIRPKDYFSPPGKGELKMDVFINDQPQLVDRAENETGAWHYNLKDQDVLTCNYYIDRKRTLIFDVRD